MRSLTRMPLSDHASRPDGRRRIPALRLFLAVAVTALAGAVLVPQNALAGTKPAPRPAASGGVTASRTGTAAASSAAVAAGSINPAAVGVLPLGVRSSCTPGNFCIWANENFDDGPGQWSGNASNYSSWPHAGCGVLSLYTWDNCASSLFNNGQTCNLTAYDGINYTGPFLSLPKGSYLAFMTQNRMSNGEVANDVLSSHKWCTF